MSNQAMQKELSRVRLLKRAAESEVQFLRSEMEQGNIHLRVSEDKNFRQEVAESVVEMASPGWSKEYQGIFFADPVEGKIYFKESNAPWNPWSDGIDFRIVSVDDIVDQENNNFDPSVDWNFHPLKWEILEVSPEGEWEEAYEWALSQPEWLELIKEAEQESWEDAVSFAKSEIKDEIVV